MHTWHWNKLLSLLSSAFVCWNTLVEEKREKPYTQKSVHLFFWYPICILLLVVMYWWRWWWSSCNILYGSTLLCIIWLYTSSGFFLYMLLYFSASVTIMSKHYRDDIGLGIQKIYVHKLWLVLSEFWPSDRAYLYFLQIITFMALIKPEKM